MNRLLCVACVEHFSSEDPGLSALYKGKFVRFSICSACLELYRDKSCERQKSSPSIVSAASNISMAAQPA